LAKSYAGPANLTAPHQTLRWLAKPYVDPEDFTPRRQTLQRFAKPYAGSANSTPPRQTLRWPRKLYGAPPNFAAAWRTRHTNAMRRPAPRARFLVSWNEKKRSAVVGPLPGDRRGVLPCLGRLRTGDGNAWRPRHGDLRPPLHRCDPQHLSVPGG